MNWLVGLLSPLTTLGSTYLEGKNAVSKAKSEAAVIGVKADADVKVAGALAANKLAETGQTQEYNLDHIAMQQMDKSIVDDLMIALLLLPVGASFIGYSVEVTAAFKSFAAMPEWYQYLVIGVYVVKFGLRGLLTKLVSGKLGNIKLK